MIKKIITILVSMCMVGIMSVQAFATNVDAPTSTVTAERANGTRSIVSEFDDITLAAGGSWAGGTFVVAQNANIIFSVKLDNEVQTSAVKMGYYVHGTTNWHYCSVSHSMESGKHKYTVLITIPAEGSYDVFIENFTGVQNTFRKPRVEIL